MEEPLFLSVVIPTYNRVDRLRLTLDGLARQTWPADRFEVLVVSDGSTDGTEEMVRAYADRAPFRLRLFTQCNAGPSRARNHAVGQACGEVIVFIDDDIEPMPELLAAHAAHHLRDERIAVIGPMLPDPARQSVEPPWIAWEHAMLQKQYTNWRNGVWRGVGPHNFYSGNASVRRDVFLLSRGFDERFKRQEDVELACRLQRDSGVRFIYEADAVGVHRPTRSLTSWLAIPAAYGRLDVTRACHGSGDWNVIRQGYHARTRATRLLADLTLCFPLLMSPLRGLLLAGAQLCYRSGVRKRALDLLSAVYNLCYLEAARAELGSSHQMHQLLHQPTGSRSSAKG